MLGGEMGTWLQDSHRDGGTILMFDKSEGIITGLSSVK